MHVSVYLWQKKNNFGTLRSRDFIFGILHTQLMKQFQLSGDLDLYSNIANLNLLGSVFHQGFSGTCVHVFDFSV